MSVHQGWEASMTLVQRYAIAVVSAVLLTITATGARAQVTPTPSKEAQDRLLNRQLDRIDLEGQTLRSDLEKANASGRKCADKDTKEFQSRYDEWTSKYRSLLKQAKDEKIELGTFKLDNLARDLNMRIRWVGGKCEKPGQPYTQFYVVGGPLATQTSWTGFYLGGALGANWTGGTWTTTELRSLGVSDALIDAIKDMQATDIAEQVYAGYFWDLDSPGWLAGLEADWAYYNAVMDPGIPGTGGLPGNKASDSVNVRAKWSASLRGRVGYLVTPTTQVYVAGGPSWLNMNATVNCTGPGVCGTNGIPAFSQTNSTTKIGWTLGGGVERMLWGNWRGRAEYRYADYGTSTTSFGTPARLALTADIKVHTHTMLFGLSYAFGGAPAVEPRSIKITK
jgi:opacity protein-like surface antigen